MDIGCTTPMLSDEFWESQHPNFPLFTPLQQIPQSPVTTIQMGSDEPHATPSVHEEIPVTSAEDHVNEELKSQAATGEAPKIPQPVEPDIEIPEDVMQLTDTPHLSQRIHSQRSRNSRLTISSASTYSSLTTILMTLLV